MKIISLINIMLALTLGITSSYASSINRVDENEITAYFDNPVIFGSAEVALFYDDKLLSTISIHGGRPRNDISWLVQNKSLSCEKFEEKTPHLYVTKNRTH